MFMNIGTSGILMEIFVRALASSIAADLVGEGERAADVAGPTGAADGTDVGEGSADVASDTPTSDSYKVRQLYTYTSYRPVLYILHTSLHGYICI